MRFALTQEAASLADVMAMRAVLVNILIACVVLFVYHHILYPILLAMLARVARAVRRPQTLATPDIQPSITMLVPAHNEEGVIASKIKNLAATDYQSDKLSIVVALDGCTDGTRKAVEAAIAELMVTTSGRRAASRMKIVEYPTNIGKVAVLNHQISQIKSDIVCLSDTSASLPADAMLRAVRHFSDPRVGVVAPTYKLVRAGSEGERAYTDYLTEMRRYEAEIDSPLGCHGACYLFRRALWSPLPADVINDDFILPMLIIAAGYRGVYDTSIVCLELETTSRRQEFRRRVRVGAGNMQQSIRLVKLLDPRRPYLAFMFASGKGLRPLMPFILVLGALAAVGLAIGGFVPIQIGLLCAGLTSIALLIARQSRPVSWIVYLVEGYAASLVGAIKILTGKNLGFWQPGVRHHAAAIAANQIWPREETTRLWTLDQNY